MSDFIEFLAETGLVAIGHNAPRRITSFRSFGSKTEIVGSVFDRLLL